MKKIDLKLSIHDFRVVTGQERKKLVFNLVVHFKFKMYDFKFKILICDEIEKDNPCKFEVIQIDRNYTDI